MKGTEEFKQKKFEKAIYFFSEVICKFLFSFLFLHIEIDKN